MTDTIELVSALETAGLRQVAENCRQNATPDAVFSAITSISAAISGVADDDPAIHSLKTALRCANLCWEKLSG
jgi:hypothetical protein